MGYVVTISKHGTRLGFIRYNKRAKRKPCDWYLAPGVAVTKYLTVYDKVLATRAAKKAKHHGYLIQVVPQETITLWKEFR